MRTLFLLTILAGHAKAQAVSPSHFTATESPWRSSTPFGDFHALATPFRYLQVHSDVPPMTIHDIAFRHDSVFTGAPQPSFTLTLDVWMSTAPVGITPQTPSATFDNNHGLDRTHVVTNRTVAVPGNNPAAVPGSFVLDIPFDSGVQFVYAAGGSSLVWEVQITARTNPASIAFDAVSAISPYPVNPQWGRSQAFTGCLTTGQTTPITLNPQASTNWPGNTIAISALAQPMLPGSIAIWVSGLSTTSWNGVPLPIDVPGSAGAPSGTCTLRTDVLDVRVVSVGPGFASLSLSFPANPAFHGATIYTQAVGIDPAANPSGFTISNLAIQQVCAPYTTPLPARHVETPGLGPLGSILSDCLVTRFY